jgi:rfaE bifunctional protein kinase chain/domain
MSSLVDVIDTFSNTHVAVVGDLILDRYTWGSTRRISPEAPVPVVDVEDQSVKLGGAGNAAQVMSALGAEVTVYARVGRDNEGETLKELVRDRGMNFQSLPNDEGYPTTVKTRVIAGGQHLVRIDNEDRTRLEEENLRSDSTIRDELSDYDGVLLSDYGKGVLSDETLPVLLNWMEEVGQSVVVDPYTDHFPLYRNVSNITPNESEFREGMGDRGPNDTELDRLAERAFDELSPEALLVTQGERGMTLYEAGGSPHRIDTEARDVYDVTGAGDTVSGVVTLGEASGVDRETAVSLANTAAGIVVGRMGTAAVTAEELREEISGS